MWERGRMVFIELSCNFEQGIACLLAEYENRYHPSYPVEYRAMYGTEIDRDGHYKAKWV